MLELLTVREVAALKGCSIRQVQSLVSGGKIYSLEQINEKNRKQFMIPAAELDRPLQLKYYKQRYGEVPLQLVRAQKSPNVVKGKSLEQFSADQREEIGRWIRILNDWRVFRAGYKSKAEADRAFISRCREEYGRELHISKDILYRKWEAKERDDLDGLVDKRGQWKKGKSEVPQQIKDIFLYTYLDETALPVKKCMEATERIIKTECPELVDQIPSYDTFYRWSKECPAPVAALARDGDKAFNDSYGIYVDRLYDDMVSNDYWIADGHTIDVITKTDDGTDCRHRLTLSAFIDARSGIYVGWVVTDNPSSDATLLALRKAIMRYGIPKYIYVDNGREYLNIDIGGMGHRARKRKVELKLPTPILARLGIQMTNALPRNAQAKIIEREFRNFTFLSRLFETYCGSNPSVKPEKLKHKLKAGRIPTDGELVNVVNDMLEGYFNLMTYNGKVVADRGKTRMQVYNDQLGAIRIANEDDLNLMMMRSSRIQTIGKNGVYVRISGEKIFYFDDDLLMMQGKQVFVRYDPEVLDEVRIYDENEVFLKTAPLRMDMVLNYGASKDEVAHAMAEKRRWRRKAKDEVNIIRETIVSQYGHINMLDVFVRAAHISREGLLAPAKSSVITVTIPEERTLAAVSGGAPVMVDRSRMIKNNER